MSLCTLSIRYKVVDIGNKIINNNDNLAHEENEGGRVARIMTRRRDDFSLFRSIKEPVQFWGEIAKGFYWETPATDDKFFSYNFDLSKGDIFIKWMEGASTNISFNLLDKNVKSGNGDKIAFYW